MARREAAPLSTRLANQDHDDDQGKIVVMVSYEYVMPDGDILCVVRTPARTLVVHGPSHNLNLAHNALLFSATVQGLIMDHDAINPAGLISVICLLLVAETLLISGSVSS